MSFNFEWIKNNKFQFTLITLLVILFIVMSIKSRSELFVAGNSNSNNIPAQKSEAVTEQHTVEVFHHPNCHACKDEIQYIEETLKQKFPGVKFNYHDVTSSEKKELMRDYYRRYGINTSDMVTPSTFIGKNYLIGYQTDEKSGEQIRVMIKKNLLEEKLTEQEKKIISGIKKQGTEYVDTWFGRVNVLEKSLPVLALTLGLADGFNPCAMWMLVYLISLIAGLKQKDKIWLIVGSFVIASGVLYFLFMTALLNVFLYIGYLRILEILFGCMALYIGVTDLKIYLIDKGQVACKVGGVEPKSRIKNKIRSLVEGKLSIITILGVITLAFVVNSMEFVCSAALPAVFTNILSKADLSSVVYYLYILLYVFFFLLNQIIIFSTAAFAIERFAPEKYMVHIQLIGGGLLLVLGIIMVFFPEYLR